MEELSALAENAPTVAATAGSRGPIVAAVNVRESRWFLEAASPRAVEKYGFSYKNLALRGWSHSPDEICALNPEVLLTCWSTPKLPDAWLESPSCRLRYICHLTGSVRHVVSRRFIERGGWVTNWGSLPADAVAEHALLLALAALRNLSLWRKRFDERDPAKNPVEDLRAITLFGKRIGIHGFGSVARALVQLLAPFRTSIVAYAPGVPEDDFRRLGVRRLGSVREMLLGSDVVFECEALTEATRNVIGAPELAALRDDGVVVNVARGGIIQEAALLREAESGRLRIALDVFATEPLPADSPWLRLPGVVLSPHIAGPTYDQYAACTDTAFRNVQKFLKRQPLDHVVTPEIYDRST